MTKTIALNPYPFGSAMPTRGWSDNGREYRFGFKTQEKDNEVAGDGNSYTAEFWQYDGRLGRRWNIDPRPNPSISCFSVFGNSPLLNTDTKGDTIKIVGSPKFIKRTQKALDRMKKTAEGRRLYDKIQSNSSVFSIRERTEKEGNITKTGNYNNEAALQGWNIGDIGFTGSNRNTADQYAGRGGWLSLAHELAHTEDVIDGNISNNTWQTPDHSFDITDPFNGQIYPVSVDPIFMDEVNAVHKENIMRAQAGIKLRRFYNKYSRAFYDNPTGVQEQAIVTHYSQKLVSDQGTGTHPDYQNYNYREQTGHNRLYNKITFMFKKVN